MTAVVDKKLMANARLTALFDEGTLQYVASQVDGIGAFIALDDGVDQVAVDLDIIIAG